MDQEFKLNYNGMLDTRDQYILDSGLTENMGSKDSMWWLWLLLLVVGIGLLLWFVIKVVLPIVFPPAAIGGLL